MPTKTPPPPAYGPRADTFAGLSSTGAWWMVQSIAGEEKALARHFYAADVPYYLPMERVIHETPQGRQYETHQAYFPGYLFLCGSFEDRWRAGDIARLRGRTAAKIKDVPDQECFAGRLAEVSRYLDEHPDAQDREGLGTGVLCRVTQGAFRGCEAVIDELTGQGFALMTLPFLGRPRPVQLPLWKLQRVNTPLTRAS